MPTNESFDLKPLTDIELNESQFDNDYDLGVLNEVLDVLKEAIDAN